MVVRATRLMNSSAASTMPTSTATVRSASTVSENVASHTATSVYECFNSSGISPHSPMFRATTNRMAASTGKGTCAANGAA